MEKVKAVALQTARNGSQGVKNKNTMLVNGNPLFTINIDHLNKSKYVKRIYLSTDIPEAKTLTDKHNFTLIERPKALCSSTASHYDAMRHGVDIILKDQDFEYIVIVLGNSIGAFASDIDECIEFLDENLEYDSCQSVAEHNWHTPLRACFIEDEKLVPFMNDNTINNPNDRKSLGDCYFFNGSFFVIRKDVFLSYDGMLPFKWGGNTIKPFIQNQIYMELDSDWQKIMFRGNYENN